MEEHFDLNQALRVYQKVISMGEKREDKYYFQGISAWSDFDGYTVQLSDEHVSVNIYFHNKFEFKYSDSKQLKIFIDKLNHIDEVDS